jgi:hypothetical protein
MIWDDTYDSTKKVIFSRNWYIMRSIFFFSHLPYLYFSAFFRQKHANFPQIIDSSLQKKKEHKMCIVATSFGKSLKLNNREHSGWFCMKLSKKYSAFFALVYVSFNPKKWPLSVNQIIRQSFRRKKINVIFGQNSAILAKV